MEDYLSKERNILKHSRRKFYVQSVILEILVIQRYKNDNKYINSEELKDIFFKYHSTYDLYYRASIKQVRFYIAQLSWTELIEVIEVIEENQDKKENFIRITDAGFKLYQESTLENIAVNLINSRATNRLSIIAIIISIATMIITIFALFCK